MKLDYRGEERRPAGAQLVEDGAGCSLSLGSIPAVFVVGTAGVLLGLAAVYAGIGGWAAWRQWWWGNGIDVRMVLAMCVSALFLGGCGAMILRRHRQHGHRQAVYRVDESTGVFARLDERGVRAQEWALGSVGDVRVRDVRLPWGTTLGVLLVIRVPGTLLVALFGRSERDAVEGFARRLRGAVGAVRSGVPEETVAPPGLYFDAIETHDLRRGL